MVVPVYVLVVFSRLVVAGRLAVVIFSLFAVSVV
jgi:hypothetical protein